MMQITVPPGVAPGQTFNVKVPMIDQSQMVAAPAPIMGAVVGQPMPIGQPMVQMGQALPSAPMMQAAPVVGQPMMPMQPMAPPGQSPQAPVASIPLDM